jgi:valyl-tRNA synthetase
MSTLAHLIHRNYQDNPQKTSIVLQQAGQEDVSISHYDLVAGSARYAGLYAHAGIQPGEVVVLILQHGVDLIHAFWGAILYGAIPSIMPFLTEELWHRLPGERGLLALESWPPTSDAPRDAAAEADVARLQEIVVKIRNLRSECRSEPGKLIRIMLHTEDRPLHGLLEAETSRVATLVRASEVEIVAALDPAVVAARGVGGGVQIAIPLAGLLDLEAEGKRIRRDLARVTADVAGRARKLADSRFLAGAPPEIVDKERRLHAELLQEQAKIERHLTTLGLSPSDSG